MIALRAATSARVAVSRAPASMFVRYYAPDIRSEGATASSTSFHEREQAKEAQYVRQREAEKLKAAKAKLAEAQAEVVSRLPLFHASISITILSSFSTAVYL
ncbi:hypothetical protein CNBA7670 [Cryptococcus deneoformans B-3501A]|uniref:hypothetical protein n=1 Tax=Cryptococcus deneoformans (strain B-3501A) TaxID=283643 RepID=UPI000042FA9C|nr:hypothetical protein CNBA7670 [Cryptococcus neoformans var. neoformans B-3501A]EAL22999.1 hypothetical protein CNBA7670 [Cryptococcus neoformans var. neoformans B-3501A]